MPTDPREMGDARAARLPTSAAQPEEDSLHLAALSASDIIYEWDLGSGALQWFGPVETLLGCDPAAVPRTIDAFLQVVHPDDQEHLRTIVATGLQAGRPWQSAYRVLRHDGSIARWHGSGIGRHDSAGRPVLVIGAVSDLTERTRAEEALRETERRLGALSDNLKGGLVYQIDSGPDGSSRRFLYVSAGVEQLHGVTVEQALADPTAIYGQVLAEDAARVIDGEARAAAGMTPFSVEVRLQLPSGQQRWSLFSSAPRRLASGHVVWDGIEIDITERKRAEEALRASEHKYRALFEQSVDGIYLHDREGRILDVNPVACAQSGYTREELLQRTIFDHLAEPFDREAILRLWCAWQPGQRVTLEAVHLRKDRTPYPVEVSTGIVQHEGRDLLLAVSRDISARRQAEEERERLRAQLAQANKMEAVGRLAGGVAHDFNNMLLAILGNTEMALEQLDPDSLLASDLREIRKAAERSADLTRQLLAFARKQTIAPRVLDLNQVVGSALKMLRRLLGEGVELHWSPGAEVWPVLMDPTQIDQILTNLCVNARDAVGGQGAITIESGCCTLDGAYCEQERDAQPGEYAVLSVSDSGCGMDPSTLARLFEPFFTTKELGRGTGLGLSTVHGIVKQNGGHITAYSEPGHGTTFRVYLPRAACASTAPTATASSPAAPLGHESILLVEDEPTILKVGARLLERLGYTVLTAATPGEAIERARQHAGALHLLMTDVVMPEMNGRELARNLQSLYPGLRCLFMSGYTADVIAHHGVLEEGVRFLQKPFSRDELASKVREALDG